MKRINSLLATVVAIALVVAACGSNDDSRPVELTVVAYDSFTLPDDAFASFTEATGIVVRVVSAGDTGEMVAKAALTAGNPEGDVMWGVDNTTLARALAADVFSPYVSAEPALDPDLVAAGSGMVTPVDFGDVCVNYDVAALAARGVEPPNTLDDLADPRYADMLVTPSASSSSPGLAFLLASVVAFGDGWTDYWRRLVANGVLVVDGWTDAYYTSFSRYGGDRPLVVSYASSPPAEVLFADPPLPTGAPAPTGVATGTCFRQIEFAGVLRGTDHEDEARSLIDHLVGREFQSLLPESIFVYPANTTTPLPRVFIDHTAVVDDPWTMSAAAIAAGRAEWIDEWSAIAL